jgi:hypothetical protein
LKTNGINHDLSKCTNSAEAIVNRLIDNSESFFSTYTPYSWCTTVSLCPLPCCLTNSPEQVHISVTGDPTQMAVTWIQASGYLRPWVGRKDTNNIMHYS